jgi:hypothetical protein
LVSVASFSSSDYFPPALIPLPPPRCPKPGWFPRAYPEEDQMQAVAVTVTVQESDLLIQCTNNKCVPCRLCTRHCSKFKEERSNKADISLSCTAFTI